MGGPNSSIQRLSHLLDLILKPLCPEMPSFIRDDIDFLYHLPQNTEKESALAIFDVVSLYTNIAHDIGEEAVKYWLAKCRDKIDSLFKDRFITEGLNLVLKRNVFYFDGKYFIQNTGTAMGTSVAPTYATLVMGYLEETLFMNSQRKYGTEVAVYVRKNWMRFLDDCFIKWNTSLLSLPIENFCVELNSLHPKIQLQWRSAKKKFPSWIP